MLFGHLHYFLKASCYLKYRLQSPKAS